MNLFPISARRRNAAKRKKLKSLGKSKSTDTEEEEAEEDYGDDGKKDMQNSTFFVFAKSVQNFTKIFLNSKDCRGSATQQRNIFQAYSI